MCKTHRKCQLKIGSKSSFDCFQKKNKDIVKLNALQSLDTMAMRTLHPMILSPYALKYRPLHCRRYVNDMFVLFKSLDPLKRSQSYLNFCRVNMSFTIKTEVNVISEKQLSRKLY